MMTPYDKLKSIENANNYLKPGITFKILDKIAFNQTDDQAAEQLQKECLKLFKTISERHLMLKAPFNKTRTLIAALQALAKCARIEPGCTTVEGVIKKIRMTRSHD